MTENKSLILKELYTSQMITVKGHCSEIISMKRGEYTG